MKFWKSALYTAVTFVGLGSTVLYTACQDDSCKRLSCMNGSSCRDGYCNCKTGYEGAECQTLTMSRFLGQYVGYDHYHGLSLVDTVDVTFLAQPDSVYVHRHGDSTNAIFIGRTIGNDIVLNPITDSGSTAVRKFTAYITKFTDSTKLNFNDQYYPDSNVSANVSAHEFIGFRP